MPIVVTPFFRKLLFKFDARTSRGAMREHHAHYIRIHHTDNPQVQGWGECSPLPGLSLDYRPDFYQVLQELCREYNSLELKRGQEEEGEYFWLKLQDFPSILFAWETAWVDFLRGGNKVLYKSSFTRGESGIKMNGLVWMGEAAFMREQIEKKLEQGFTCLKLKIGGLDFVQEIKILREIRKVAGADQLELRLDANGAFAVQEAEEKLRELALFDIHSIEQPIRQGQLEAMQLLCGVSPIPIALDEELIGVQGTEQKWKLLDFIRPAYVILKPTLTGGLSSSRSWIQVAESLGIAWWLTSALESNIGLNAIAQFAAEFHNPLPQGLGTGQLYHNNLASPLQVRGEELWYNPEQSWELPT
ncbi:o-succinylbenzoate synthase [Rufibacter ruber]|uniref:o-succinylbenzoate synthase n=1 Tax=Rufibacter ruber TaxID=1783499 RepID=UPI00083038A9|nr:o-succinylbenzoate synthase [Rufibacter ruber]